MAVKSAERVLRIFELLKEHPDGLTNKEISDQLGYAASSTLAILQTLVDNGYLKVRDKNYRLGNKLLSLGLAVESNMDMTMIAEPILKELMETVQETCFLAVLSGDEVVYMAKQKSTMTVATNVTIGARRPVFATGLGKAFLAFLPEDQSNELLKKMPHERYTENTVIDKDVMKAQIQEFRKQGYAIDNQEMEEGLWCVAVPIYNALHKVVATLSVSGPYERMQSKKDLVIREAKAAGLEFSSQLGYEEK